MRAALLVLVVGALATGCGATTHARRAAAVHRPPPIRRHVRHVHYVRQHDSPVPILEYHVIGFHPVGSPLEGLYVTPSEFRDQVAWLAANGWHTVTLGSVARFWLDRIALPRKPIVLSFDDGYPGDWQYAMPILRAHHFVGVLNLQIGNIVPKHVRELMRAGWEIDSHTFVHPDLRAVSDAELAHEVIVSRLRLQRTYGIAVPAFCYPFGYYDARVVSAVRDAGYQLAETENQGWASPSQGLDTLSRIRITPSTGVAGLAAWLHG